MLGQSLCDLMYSGVHCMRWDSTTGMALDMALGPMDSFMNRPHR